MAQVGALGKSAYGGTSTNQRLAQFFGLNGLPLVLAWPILGVVVLLTLLIFYMTFLPGLPIEGGFTLRHWARLSDPYLYARVIPNTVIVGIGSVLVTLTFALPMAWFLNRTSMPFRRVFITFIALTVVIPGFIKAMGWLLLFQERLGILNRSIAGALGINSLPIDLATPWGIAWVMGLSLTPTMFFLLAGPLLALDPTLEKAAWVAGASRWRTVMRVSLPLVWPSILGGTIYTLMTAVSVFEIPALLAGTGGKTPLLATELFYSVHPLSITESAYGPAGVYGALIALPSMVALYFYLRVLAQGRRYETITARGYRPEPIDLGRFTPVAVGFVLLYLILAVFLPMVVLVWTSLLPSIQIPSERSLSLITLRNYETLLPMLGGWEVVRNTVVLVVGASLLTVFFSFMISWVVVRTRMRGRGMMDAIAMLPHAVPGIAFAFVLLVIAILATRWAPFIALHGTVTVIIIANVINRLAYGTRITNAALLQVSSELESAARICGATSAAVMWRVVIPLIKPSLVYAGLWTGMLVFREVSMALMLQTTNNPVIATSVWSLWSGGRVSAASAAAVTMIVVLGAVALATQLLGGARIGEQRRGVVGT